MKVVFMGTPEFAVPSLECLYQSGHEIVAVVTTPDKPMGRGLKLRPSPVKIKATSLKVPVIQPEKLRDPEFEQSLRAVEADCFVVVAFRILPQSIFSIPVKGTINLHTSLLPKYRGAAPIQWAIMNGETETGLTTFIIEEKVDTGAILLQKRLPIFPDDTAGSLHDRMSQQGALLLEQTLDGLDSSMLFPKIQTGPGSPAPKITPEHCRIDWSRPAQEIANQIRGLAPRPAAFTSIESKRLKIYRSTVDIQNSPQISHPGSILTCSGSEFRVQTGREHLLLHELQIEGKKRLSVENFIRGTDIVVGQSFE